MKKINFILLIIISQLLINCSKSDTVSTSAPSNSSTFSMKLNTLNCIPITPTTNSVLCWNKVTNNDGTHYYTVDFLFSRNGDNSPWNQMQLQLKTENITTNQIFQVNTTSDPISQISIMDGGAIRFYNSASNSTGQIKITQFDGVTMSGEFSFGNLKETQNYSTVPFINITDGVFTNIPKKN